MLPENVLEWLWHQLEFNYTDLTRTYRDVVDCLEGVPSLRPRTDVYTTEQGYSDLLLVIFGPLAAEIAGATYGIPVEIWMPKTYPIGAPIVWVRPTSQMRINAGSKVDYNGRVYFEWTGANSLVGLCSELSHIFGLECPVYTVVEGAAGGEATRTVRPAERLPPRPEHVSHVAANIMDFDLTPAPSLPERPKEAWTKFNEEAQKTFRQIVSAEYEVDKKALDNAREVLEWTATSLEAEEQALTKSLESTTTLIKMLEDTTKTARSRIAATHNQQLSLLTADELVVPDSKDAQQLMEAMAQDCAIGETVRVLATGFANDKMELGVFLKNVRGLARQQFMERHKGDLARRRLV